jgi:hypothetical protein
MTANADLPPPLLWPPRLRRASPPPKLVSLDLKDWIALAKAMVNHPHGAKHIPTLTACRAARNAGAAVFPLSGALYMEVAKITDPAQRANLATVMEELSGFATLPSRAFVATLELDAVLSSRYGPAAEAPVFNLLGKGFAWAFGLSGSLRIASPDGDRTDWTRQLLGERWCTDAELVIERAILAGPNDQEAAGLRTHGWDPRIMETMLADNAAFEEDLRRQLDNTTRRRPRKLHDIVLTRELLNELFVKARELLTERDRSVENLDEITGDIKTVRAFVRSMPSAEVVSMLKLEDHRNRDKTWTSNDLFDIQALSVAVPYCDIVVTDSHRHHVLHTAGLDTRMDTVVLADLTTLPTYL